MNQSEQEPLGAAFKKNWLLGLVLLAVVLIASGLIICGEYLGIQLDHPQDFVEDDSRRHVVVRVAAASIVDRDAGRVGDYGKRCRLL